MIIKKEVVVESKIEKIEKVVCDCCGKEFIDVIEHDNVIRWNFSDYTALFHEYCFADRDGGSYSDITRYDICPICFKTKIMPLMREANIKANFIETDS